MGLDMYLTAEKYLGHYEFQRTMAGTWRDEYDAAEAIISAFPKLGEILDPQAPGLTVSANVGYWRKANAIHQWFVNVCQDGRDECQETWVHVDKLRELRTLCLEAKAYPEQADDLLPTTSGFFFGSTEYDEWYWKDIDKTIEILDRAIPLADEGYTIKYQSSW